ncbi:MAG: DUF6134 family protein [Ruegeria sp.]
MRFFKKIATVTVAAAIALPAFASTLPANGRIQFDVFRKGKDIGDLSYEFSGTPEAYSVKISTDIAVKVPLVRFNAYVFKQNSVEKWSGGKLASIQSATNDDGDDHKISQSGKGLLPASLWNDDIVKSRKLLNTIDGRVMNVRVTDLGVQAVPVRGGQLSAHHYRISGDLERDVWYDNQGNLAHVSFTADDGSTVTYVRK